MGQNEGAGRLALATAQEKRLKEKKGKEQQHCFAGAAFTVSLTVCSGESYKIWIHFAGPHDKNKSTRVTCGCQNIIPHMRWNLYDRGPQLQRWPTQTPCSLFPPCHSHQHPLGAAAALHADAATKQTSHCRIKL